MSFHSPSLRRRVVLPLVLAAALAPAIAAAQSTPAQPPVRVRGTIESVGADKLVVKDRSGERVTLALPANVTVTEMYPLGRDAVKSGSFVGVGAMPQPDGSQKAIAVLVFPEAMRGTGEGHRPFDFLPQSTMTNATVTGEATPSADGQRMKLAYPGGDQTIVVPPDAPIVSLRPGSRGLLVPGAGVSVTAQLVGDQPTAMRVTAGRNGFSPPY
ncbi:MAG: hypothetical protein ACJ8GO_12225 [Ramlibacter sp.]